MSPTKTKHIYDRTHDWQRRKFRALKALGANYIVFDGRPGDRSSQLAPETPLPGDLCAKEFVWHSKSPKDVVFEEIRICGKSRDGHQDLQRREVVTRVPHLESQRDGPGVLCSTTRPDAVREQPFAPGDRPTLPPLSSVLGPDYRRPRIPIRRIPRSSLQYKPYPPVRRLEVRHQESFEQHGVIRPAPIDDPPGSVRSQTKLDVALGSRPSLDALLLSQQQWAPSPAPAILRSFRSLSSVTSDPRPPSPGLAAQAHAPHTRTALGDVARESNGSGHRVHDIQPLQAPSTPRMWANRTVPPYAHQGCISPYVVNEDGTRNPFIFLDEVIVPSDVRILPPVLPAGLSLPDCIPKAALWERLSERDKYQRAMRAQVVRELNRTSKYDCIEGGRLSGRLLTDKLLPSWVPPPFHYGVYPARSAAARASPDPRDHVYSFAIVNPDIYKDPVPPKDCDDHSGDERGPPRPPVHDVLMPPVRAGPGMGAPPSSL
ncbi:hypothetical protein BV20DRAFT_967540 [Pilatotrama ljubarskyi]|nr:hypothetical protein BV20DRAFT_967540 [Pilatotrama ljubarskyi]